MKKLSSLLLALAGSLACSREESFFIKRNGYLLR